MRIRLVAASLAVSLLSLPAMAQDKVGIAACDDFLAKYEACLAKMPSASQQATKDSIQQMRAAWKAGAADANSRSALESACKSSADSMKQATASYGCSW
jgi:hypothetical protein